MNSEETFNSKPTDVPLTLAGFSLTGDDAEVQFTALAWWLPDSPRQAIHVRLGGVQSYSMTGSGASVAHAAIDRAHSLLVRGPLTSVFGQAPLPDPYRFFLEFHKAVRERLSLSRDPISYLNWPGTVTKWFGLVYSRSYHLLTAVPDVAQAACELLDAQAAEYIALPEPEPSSSKPHPELVLVFDDSWIAAKSVHVSFH